MRIDAISAGLVLSAISTLVVVIGALAGLRQLRHIRHGNELATLTELTTQFDTPEMLEARAFVGSELQTTIPRFWQNCGLFRSALAPNK